MPFITTVLGAVTSIGTAYANYENGQDDRAATERERQRQFELSQQKEKNLGRNIALGIVAFGIGGFALMRMRAA